jgi:hypothetical protein
LLNKVPFMLKVPLTPPVPVIGQVDGPVRDLCEAGGLGIVVDLLLPVEVGMICQDDADAKRQWPGDR